MAWRFVRQPNRLFARFSEVVDDFTHMNMTVEECINLARETMDAQNARDKVQRAIDDEGEDCNKGDGLNRWRHAIKMIEAIHGKQAVANVKRILLER